MAYSPATVSNNILRRAFEEGVEVSPMKLQKILYFAACEYSKKTANPLLSEEFQQWQYGPVLGSVYSEFRSFRASPIRAYAKDAEGNAFMIKESDDKMLKEILDAVWAKTKQRTAVDLSRITHSPGSAWYNALQNSERFIRDEALAGDDTYGPLLGLG